MRIVLGLLEPDTGAVRWRGGAADRSGPPAHRLHARGARALPADGRRRSRWPTSVDCPASTPSRPERRRPRCSTASGLGARADDKVQMLSRSATSSGCSWPSALVHGPNLLVLDEPFSGLDPVGVDVLAAVLREEATGDAAIVFSSHQLELIERICDEVTIIEAGRVVASGTVDAVRSSRARSRLRVGLEGGWRHVGGVARGDQVRRRRGRRCRPRARAGGRRPVRARRRPCGRPRALLPMGRAEPLGHLPRCRLPSGWSARGEEAA